LKVTSNALKRKLIEKIDECYNVEVGRLGIARAHNSVFWNNHIALLWYDNIIFYFCMVSSVKFMDLEWYHEAGLKTIWKHLIRLQKHIVNFVAI